MKKNNKNIKVLDIFSGCGGLSLGFAMAGFKIVAGMDNWKDALISFENNHPGAKGLLTNLADFNIKDLDKKIEKPDIIIGGPPCQGFSISGKRNPNDPRNKLYASFVKIVKHYKPKIFVLENVPNLVSMAQGEIKNSIIRDFSKLGYTVSYKIMLASDYGVPQNRRRVVFVGLLGKKIFDFPTGNFVELDKKVTCKEALSDLPEKSVEDGKKYSRKPTTGYQRIMRSKTNKLYNHQVTEHSEQTKKIISLVPDGGNYKNLPKKYRQTRNVHIAWTRYKSDKPSLTIDTGHRHHFHYQYNRIPTARENARLQSFPDDFIFYGSRTSQHRQIGNAVPPLMAKALAEKIKKYF